MNAPRSRAQRAVDGTTFIEAAIIQIEEYKTKTGMSTFDMCGALVSLLQSQICQFPTGRRDELVEKLVAHLKRGVASYDERVAALHRTMT